MGDYRLVTRKTMQKICFAVWTQDLFQPFLCYLDEGGGANLPS